MKKGMKKSELTEALMDTPGFAQGYEQALRHQEFGAQLRACREAKGLTQSALAEAAGLDQGDISRFEVGKWGKRGVSFDKLERILPILGLQLEHRVEPLPSVAVDLELRRHLQVMNELL